MNLAVRKNVWILRDACFIRFCQNLRFRGQILCDLVPLRRMRILRIQLKKHDGVSLSSSCYSLYFQMYEYNLNFRNFWYQSKRQLPISKRSLCLYYQNSLYIICVDKAYGMEQITVNVCVKQGLNQVNLVVCIYLSVIFMHKLVVFIDGNWKL